MIQRTVAVAACVFLVSVAAEAQSRYYRSNEIAMPIEEIGWFRADEFEYVLRVDRADGSETRTLLQNGEAVSRLEVDPRPDGGRREVRSSGGATVSVEVYDVSGRIIRREDYEDGELTAVESMTYREGRLAAGELRAPDGTILSADRYAYDSEGLLREVVRSYPEGGERRSEYTFQGGALLQEWHGEEASGILIRYGSGGRETARESWEGDTLISRQSFEYGRSGVLVRSVTADFAGDTRAVVVYNDEGRPTREERTAGEEILSVTVYEYDGGELSVRREETDAGIVEWRYSYGDDAELREESLYRDGIPVKRISHPEPGRTVEERYRNGELVLRIYVRDDRRVREEVIRNGTVIQERSYE